MNRRQWLQRSAAFSTLASLTSVGAPLLLSACGGGGSEAPASGNAYRQTNLAATSASYNALFTYPDMVDAWGLAIRPAGAGGHFWVTASSKSYEFVGDVNGTPLEVDAALVDVTLPASGDNPGAANGVVFNSAGSGFRITQTLPNGETFTAPAKFVFVSDNGVISAWAQRSNADGSLSFPSYSNVVLDEGAQNSAFFGLAISPADDKLFAADFGNNPYPRVRVFDDSFVEEPIAGRFANPFVAEGSFKPGDYAPWAIHTITVNGTPAVFVAYVHTQEDPDNPGQVLLATESTGRGTSKLVEYTPDGQFVATWDDRGTLNGPWGIAFAPADFGPFSNHLIVANFTDGTLVAFDPATRSAVEFLRDTTGAYAVISGIWGILFGNGVKLGDTNALYFAAGPADETEGLFGSLRLA
jgi:uncharacterized protein (TIGR03118 family)